MQQNVPTDGHSANHRAAERARDGAVAHALSLDDWPARACRSREFVCFFTFVEHFRLTEIS
jgi:hypothetical protein